MLQLESIELLSGKTPDLGIIKTLDRIRNFKDERYITSDSIFTKCYNVKRLCKASMNMEKRSVVVKLSTTVVLST